MNRIKKSNALFFAVILQILYFIPVCSFIHVHHAHSDDGLQIIVSTHPIDRHTENHNDHHSDDHQHNESDHCEIDLTFIRPTPRIVTELPTKLYSTASLVIQNKPDLSFIIQKFDLLLPQQKIFLSLISPRSPPHLSWSILDIPVFHKVSIKNINTPYEGLLCQFAVWCCPSVLDSWWFHPLFHGMKW